MISQLRKRDGRIVSFEKSKIEDAVYKAASAVGGRDRKTAAKLADEVVRNLEATEKPNWIPAVEEVQDVVEKVLIESGHAKTAKAYILYRQRRAELREEKKRVLEKEIIDEVDKNFDLNALRVLKARYLRKDESGKLVETPKQLFTRVSVHVALPDMLYDERIFDISGKQKQPVENFVFEHVSVGEYPLNQYHFEALKRMYDRFNSQKQMKVGWSALVEMIKNHEFDDYGKNIKQYYDVMVQKKFLPNTPAIANFGNVLGMGSACFVLSVDDSMESIMDTLKHTAIIHKAGGGTGFNFSNLRPEGDYVSSTSGVASGPLSFMRLFDTMTEVVKQGGIRRGANMGIMNSNHPDIEKFIKAKDGNKGLRNFNISVLIMPDFWEHYEKNEPYPLINPRTSEVARTVNPRMLFDMLVYQAWESAEPGVIFHDTVNKYNPFLKSLGPIVTTNPCGEVLLYPNEPCNLGSINVWAFAKEDDDGNLYYDWNELKDTIVLSTKFLDNVIDVNKFPLKQIEEMSLNTRKIGLGVMGVGDLLYELGIPYNSEEGRKFMEKLMEFINYYSKVTSIELARARGPLPFFDKSFYPENRMPILGFDSKEEWQLDWTKVAEEAKKGIRNGFTIVIAPTGSISMIAGCSSGIEPVYSLVFEKNVKVGSFYYIDPVFEKVMRREGLYDEDLMAEINANHGSLQNIPYIPKKLKEVFVTAMDTTPENHIRALASFQKWVDSSISKTNNFPADATVEDMRQSYILAYKLGCKDVTVFRDTSIKDQVLVAPKKKEEADVPKKRVMVTNEGSNYNNNVAIDSAKQRGCPSCSTDLQEKEGCLTCPECGWGLCSA
ncbi:MAG: adenosylcobalamin-dependent ribonucleoside-diphosphate reductase [Candidatus Aenigmarchaeota archaeon]|nr:adenosylcobalamin-dependent ribonucleoside-diphosphate reductase [Candidatus Aenigmarchaeota archaeon]